MIPNRKIPMTGWSTIDDGLHRGEVLAEDEEYGTKEFVVLRTNHHFPNFQEVAELAARAPALLEEVEDLKRQLADAKAESRELRAVIRKVVEDTETARTNIDRALCRLGSDSVHVS